MIEKNSKGFLVYWLYVLYYYLERKINIWQKIRRRCIICVSEVNVIITYIIPQAFVITKYSSFIFTSNL